MKKLKISVIIASALMLSACYTQGGYTPAVDTYNNQNACRINQDMAECRQLAEHSADSIPPCHAV